MPLGVFGAFLGTWLRGLTNDVYVQVGLLMLIGLSAKNAILIVEYAKELYEEGRSVFDAAFEASRLRFRPIMMTAISSNLGNIPLVVATGAGALARNSLGTAVFAGYLLAHRAGSVFHPGALLCHFDIVREGTRTAPLALRLIVGTWPTSRPRGRRGLMRRLVIVFGVLLLAGCTMAPKYDRSPGEVPQEYRFQNLQGQPQAELNTLIILPKHITLSVSILEHAWVDGAALVGLTDEGPGCGGNKRPIWSVAGREANALSAIKTIGKAGNEVHHVLVFSWMKYFRPGPAERLHRPFRQCWQCIAKDIPVNQISGPGGLDVVIVAVGYVSVITSVYFEKVWIGEILVENGIGECRRGGGYDWC